MTRGKDVPKGAPIAVCGATGAQGGSVAAKCAAAGFKVRGLTRNPDSDAAKALAAKGAEVVKADLGDLERCGRGRAYVTENED